jgi:PAS domain-containing protein
MASRCLGMRGLRCRQRHRDRWPAPGLLVARQRSRNAELNELNNALTAERDYSEAIVATILEPLLVVDKELRIQQANRAFCDFFKTRSEDIQGRRLDDRGEKEWNIPEPELCERLRKVLSGEMSLDQYETSRTFPLIGAGGVPLRRYAFAFGSPSEAEERSAPPPQCKLFTVMWSSPDVIGLFSNSMKPTSSSP